MIVLYCGHCGSEKTDLIHNVPVDFIFEGKKAPDPCRVALTEISCTICNRITWVETNAIIE